MIIPAWAHLLPGRFEDRMGSSFRNFAFNPIIATDLKPPLDQIDFRSGGDRHKTEIRRTVQRPRQPSYGHSGFERIGDHPAPRPRVALTPQGRLGT